MGVINSPLVEGGVFSEEVNKKEVTVNQWYLDNLYP